MAVHNWYTDHFLPSPNSPPNRSIPPTEATPAPALIILNQSIPINPQPKSYREIFDVLWRSSGIRLCADGGANRVWDYLGLIGREEEGGVERLRCHYLPNSIIGDLDSLLPSTAAYYVSKGVTVRKDPSQYSTDLQKCMTVIENEEDQTRPPTPIVILGGLSGRLDQTTHLLHLLHKLRLRLPVHSSSGRDASSCEATSSAIPMAQTEDEKLKGKSTDPYWKPGRGAGKRDIRVVSENCVAWVLDAGEHHIHIDHARFGQTCGVLPLGVDGSEVRTEGLKWDVDWTTSFDTVVSTSNHLLPEVPVVKIWTSRPVWWTMEIKY